MLPAGWHAQNCTEAANLTHIVFVHHMLGLVHLR